ncbi:methyltransferase domain-containing protein [Amycolatopsis anabasis]|uniref:methyltransferase domain-containing protein n=1 Tax=Amycolatopsis anabasis TaxID=1840409 RepID=UPI00131CCC9C|nr:methyltransferase domain-containing protein [Amycolatopsis anabasis]
MSETRVAHALSRLAEHYELHLPLRRTDVLGRLALRFLWRRHLKWQVETNLAVREALEGLEEARRTQQTGLDRIAERGDLVTHPQLAHEVALLKQSDQNLTAGLNQRLYAAIGRLQSQLSDLRLQLTEAAEKSDESQQRLKAAEEQLATLNSAARDVRSRHAQLDVFLDELRAGKTAAETANTVADRDSFLELAVSELLDGPADRVRADRATCLPVVTEAREKGATGPVLDLAPGRGEWLEVLRTAAVPHRAASVNSLVRRHSADLGLTIEDAEPLDALAGTPRRSLGAVTAFRYAERLDPAALARMVDAAAAALQPGGVLLVETPEAGDDFHLDPFARRPVHPAFLRFLAEAAGFANVAVRTGEPGGRYRLIAWR